MATIRTQFRGMFATSIILLLVVCSVAIWLWARFIIQEQAQGLIRRDVKRLASEIVWQPQLGAFELRSSSTSLLYTLTCDYWQIADSQGRILWKSESWRGYRGPIPFDNLENATPVFPISSPGGKSTLLASARDVVIDESSARTSMLEEFPTAVRISLQRIAPQAEVLATELEFADDQFRYEIITRQGDELVEVEMNDTGQLMGETRRRVPTALPSLVQETFERAHPGAKISDFDWRASQGFLQFIINGVSPTGEKLRDAISSSGQLIPLYFPPTSQPSPEGRFRIIVADEQGWRHGLLQQLGWILAGVCGSGFIAAWFLSMWLADRALQPMGSIARKARLIDEKRLSERLSGGRPDDEIGILVQAINGMLDRIESAFERQRRFARDASHELRGPLTGLIAQLELARSQLPEASPSSTHLERALERSQRMRDLIDKLLLLARQESDNPVSMRDDIAIEECLDNVVADFPDAVRDRIRLSHQPGGDGRFVHGNEELLHAMFRNIVDNALKFSRPEHFVDVRVSEADSWIRVEISDQGAGIPTAARDQVFEPFVRLRQAAVSQVEGAGLGLSIVKWIAKLHHARVEIDSRPGEGTRFCVLLPETREQPTE